MSVETWQRFRLADVVTDVFAGAWGDSPTDSRASNVQVLRATNIDSDGRIDYRSPAHRVFNTREISRKSLRVGDLLLEASGGGPGTPVGRVALHVGADSEIVFACSNFFRAMRPDRNVILPGYLACMLERLYRSPEIWKYQQQTTGLVNLKFRDYLNQLILIPPLGEQQRIVELINVLSDAKRGIEASIAKLRSVRQGVLLDFMAKIKPQWTPVSEVGEVRMGKQLSPDSRASGEQYPYLRVANVYAGHIDYSDVNSMGYTKAERAAYGLVPGDILLNEGQSLELVGRSAIYREAPGAFFFQNTLIRFRCGEKVMPEYAQIVFEYWLRAGVFAAIAKQTTSIAHLGGGRFSALEFPLVSLSDQQTLVASVASCDESLRVEADQLAKVRLLKRGLVDDLLSGQVAFSVAGV
ncbi:restriction endonuclease subunit S [Streptomyces zagrosensis]|uniref:Type I restriction enzyme S subunit n=1 Tax=Streptomyces zagrosensis TaxID=1042984 RepID=A0A7W9Q7G4_9ACTN|nr:hypothetical protein [Streptomyces zagrosensis]MBB5934975.1 type I restriction enzyme S subunit [Streptomyces zagrosensis]